MKKLTLNSWSVQAMNTHEVRNQNGGCKNDSQIIDLLFEVILSDNIKQKNSAYTKLSEMLKNCDTDWSSIF